MGINLIFTEGKGFFDLDSVTSSESDSKSESESETSVII